MGEAANTLSITIQSVISALIVYVAGFLLVKFRKIDASTVVGLSSVVNNCLLPSLLFIRLGSHLSDEVISYAYSLFILNIGISVATFLFSNFILVPIAQPSRSFVPWFNLGQVVPNEFSLPLLFVTSVCKEVSVAVPEFFEDEHVPDPSGTAHRMLQEEYEPTLTEHECIEIGELYTFLYALPLTLALFTLGPIYLSRFRAIPPTIEVIKESQNPLSMLSHFEDLQPLSRIESGRARSRPGQTNYSKPLSFFSTKASKAGSQFNSKDQLNSRLDELVLNDSRDDEKPISQMDRDFEPAASIGGHDGNMWDGCIHVLKDLASDPPAIALLLGLFVGLIPQIQDFLFDEGPFHSLTDGIAVLGGGTSSGLNLIMACTLALKLFALENKWDAFGNEQRVGISRRTLFVYAGAKMILVPLIWFGALQAIYPALVPDDALLKFAVNLIVMMPTSTLLVMLAQVTGDMVSAEILAIAGLLQFMIGLVTITALMFMSLLSLEMTV